MADAVLRGPVLGYLTAMVVGFATWLVYGVLADATAVVVTNTLSLGWPRRSWA